MATPIQKPTIVMVPGSFSSPQFYDTFVSHLSGHNYEVQVVSLPSVGGQIATNMTDDATAIQAVTTKLADEGKDIVVVMHSYGGIPGTESAYGIRRKEREASGKKGGIVALVYAAALLVKPGMSLGSTMGEGAGVPDYVKVDVSIPSVSIVHGIVVPV